MIAEIADKERIYMPGALKPQDAHLSNDIIFDLHRCHKLVPKHEEDHDEFLKVERMLLLNKKN